MSAAVEQPGTATQPGATPPEAGSGASASSETGASAPSDYKQRVGAGGEFAVTEVTKHQGRADRAEAANRELIGKLGGENSSLLQLVNKYGVDQVMGTLNEYGRITSDPRIAQAIEAIETGGQPATATNTAPDDDEYLTDEQREIRELRAELKAATSQLSELTVNTGGAALQGHLESVFGDLNLTQEEIGSIEQSFKQQVSEWSKTDQGRAVLRGLQKSTAKADVRALVLKLLPDDTLFGLGERRRLREQNRLRDFETDGPSGFEANEADDMPEVKGIHAAFEAARANPGALRRMYPNTPG